MSVTKKTMFYAITIGVFFLFLTGNSLEGTAKSKYDTYELSLNHSHVTLYTGQEPTLIQSGIGAYMQLDEKIVSTIRNNLQWTSSNPNVVQFVTSTYYINGVVDKYETTGKCSGTASVRLLGVTEGTATITLKSPQLKKTLSFKVTVKNAELTCNDSVYYANNTYTFFMAGNATATTFSSSNKKVATIDSATGVLKTKKTGTTTISCVCADGTTYKCKITVKKQGLNYTKLTSYYYTGMIKGYYNTFPLIAAGINVKKWKSSNPKVCTVKSHGSLCTLQVRGLGKATITCTAKNGKKYKCKLTVTGEGKTWGAYRVPLSSLKKHGYYKDINKIMDYGNVIATIVTTSNEVALKNGSTLSRDFLLSEPEKILSDRYPEQQIHEGGGGYVWITNDKKTKTSVLQVYYYYVD